MVFSPLARVCTCAFTRDVLAYTSMHMYIYACTCTYTYAYYIFIGIRQHAHMQHAYGLYKYIFWHTPACTLQHACIYTCVDRLLFFCWHLAGRCKPPAGTHFYLRGAWARNSGTTGECTSIALAPHPGVLCTPTC